MIVFEGAPGRVVTFRDNAVSANIVPLVRTTPSFGFGGERSIITRLTAAQQTSQQFLHTLGGDIYIYVFGDRIGQLTLSGLTFGPDCESPGNNNITGIERVFRWYSANKLSARRTPVIAQVSNVAITGFVSNMNIDVVDPKAWISQYSITMMITTPTFPTFMGPTL